MTGVCFLCAIVFAVAGDPIGSNLPEQVDEK